MKTLAEIGMYILFATVVGVLSAWPSYELMDDKHAIVSIVFKHAGKRIGECRQFSQEELNKLPPNMRKPADCPRERHPVRIELRAGETVLYGETILPSGIWADGKANVYQRVEVPSGVHKLFIGMNDSGGNSQFDYSKTATIDLSPRRNLVIQFDEELKQFSIR